MRALVWLVALLGFSLVAVAAADDRGLPHGKAHEVWALDQSNTLRYDERRRVVRL